MSSAAPRPGLLGRWTQDHLREFVATVGRLYREPVSTLLTAAVVGITLALPAGLHLLVKNLSAISFSWEGSLQTSLFLKDSVSAARGRALAQELRRRRGVQKSEYISREQSLAEFRELSGFGEALQLLEDNPLPAVIVITPDTRDGAEATDRLMTELTRLPEVELAKVDHKWLERLYAILGVVERSVLILSAVLALAVIVTVGNTIRLDIENRRDEIVVMKLIGAPDAFIRRPFLHTGICYGLAGGAIAWIFVHGALLALSGPARRLAGLYESGFSLSGLSFSATLAMLGAGFLLGAIGSFWTVSRHLGKIEPA